MIILRAKSAGFSNLRYTRIESTSADCSARLACDIDAEEERVTQQAGIPGKVRNRDQDVPWTIQKVYPNLRINSYGHIGDGNIHLNVLPPKEISKDDFLKSNPKVREQVRMAINETTHLLGGSISAEHGIGRLKTRDLEMYASKARLKAIKSIKSALDPNNIMNPGVIIP